MAGKPESHWLVIKRCLAILQRTQQGSATKSELLQAVFKQLGEDAYGRQQKNQLTKRFEEDKRRLKEHLGVHIRYDKTVKGYVIEELEEGIFNLSDDQITTLAFLADNFQPETPNTHQVQYLIDTLLSYLPVERRGYYQKARGLAPTHDWTMREAGTIAHDVWDTVHDAWRDRQQLQFTYTALNDKDPVPTTHIVEPWRIYSDRGHYYLRAYCLSQTAAHGRHPINAYRTYRISRIVPGSAHMLPTRLPPTPRAERPLAVRYELSPRLGHFGVGPQKQFIDPPTITQLDEGWVRVEGVAYDIFSLARNLLYYGEHCHVLGGPELLKEMRQLVQGLSKIYI